MGQSGVDIVVKPFGLEEEGSPKQSIIQQGAVLSPHPRWLCGARHRRSPGSGVAATPALVIRGCSRCALALPGLACQACTQGTHTWLPSRVPGRFGSGHDRPTGPEIGFYSAANAQTQEPHTHTHTHTYPAPRRSGLNEVTKLHPQAG
jgi:hypothetical protein